uniref:ATP synthase complex subunit 8 n=1 Tax=Eutrichosiphum pasaniae TaxID=536017 RepID=A0A872ZM44_9HEMI|nr:ATP synthase F0 subunit 8 [Eutrichosiphum pasaniae]QOY44591.1 ATP synthase F0 subunit 8 [Eutrichosiphum pasaniae]
MPQMAPINWLFMFMYFLIMLYIMMNLIYFNFNKKNNIKFLNKIQIKNYNKFI